MTYETTGEQDRHLEVLSDLYDLADSVAKLAYGNAVRVDTHRAWRAYEDCCSHRTNFNNRYFAFLNAVRAGCRG